MTVLQRQLSVAKSIKTYGTSIWSDLALVVGIPLGLAIVLARDIVIPENYKFDSTKIQSIAQGWTATDGDYSFSNVADIYRFLHLANSSDAVAVISYLLAATVLVVTMAKSKHRAQAGPIEFALILISLVLFSVYLGQYSKEIVLLPVVLLVVLLPPKWWGDVAIVIAIGLYALFFRQYWALIGIAYVMYRLVNRRVVQVRTLLILGAVAAFIVGIAFTIILGVSVDYYRSIVNESRQVGANTQIEPFFTSDAPWAGLLNVLVTYFALIIPLPLLISAGFSYLPIVAVFAFIWVSLLMGLSRSGEWMNVVGGNRVAISRALSVLFAFLMTQALFEPDYGSALRHLTPLLPLVVFVRLAMKSKTL